MHATAGSVSTVTVAETDSAPVSAVTVAEPAPMAVTRPTASTVATAGESEDQVTDTSTITLPFRSRTSAVNRTVSPIPSSCAVAGEIVSDAATSGDGSGADSTVTVADADSSPVTAETVAEPAPTAMTCPVASTVATSGASDDQVTVTSAITLPFRSRTSAVNCVVSSGASSRAESGETVSDAATGGGGSGEDPVEDGSGGSPGADEPPEHAQIRTTGSAASPRRRFRTRLT